MANISSIQVGATTYDVKDATARALLSDIGLSTSAGTISSSVLPQQPNATTASNGLYKISVDSTGTVTSSVAATKQDILDLGLTSITYSLGWNDATNQLILTPSEGTGSTITIGMASSVNGHSVESNVPANAVFTDTTYEPATDSANGLMTSTMVSKLAGIEANANNYSHPTHTAAANGLYKVTVDGSGHVTSTGAVTSSDITALGIAGTDTTYGVATTSANGLMSAADKTQLNNLQNSYDNLVEDAPAAYDTLKEISDYIGQHQTEYQALNTLAGKQSDWGVTDSSAKEFIKNKPGLASSSADGFMSSGDFSKLAGVEANANKYTHPTYTTKASGLYKITVDSTGHVSDATAVQKSDITALGIPETNTTYGDASTSSRGLMTTAMVSKLNGIADNANNYTHPTYTVKSSGLYKIAVDGTGHVSSTTEVAKADITALGIPGSDTTYAAATTAANGLMTKDMVTKLNGIAASANNYSHPTHTAYTSGFYKVTVDSLGHVTAATPVTAEDITALVGSPSVQTIDGVETLVLN